MTARLDIAAVYHAVARHQHRETPGARDMRTYLGGILAGQPFPVILGPLKDGSGASGVCLHQGRSVAQWGDPSAVEMSFSVTKIYLSLVAGLAWDQGLFADVAEPVARTVDHQAFHGPRHGAITWHHLLQQTSEWGGTLWGVPWWADPQGGQPRDHPLAEPGTVFAYNDVRSNLLSMALLHLFRRPLPAVLAEHVMEPVGASDTWQWHGYRTSEAEIDGRRVQSVSGGGHWGGGLWASAYDHARIGVLYLQDGRWGDRAILSEQWVRDSWAAGAVRSDYGYLWWRNDDGAIFARAPRTGRCARGNGGRQLIWVDPPRDLVVVSRWTEDVESLLVDISAAIPDSV